MTASAAANAPGKMRVFTSTVESVLASSMERVADFRGEFTRHGLHGGGAFRNRPTASPPVHCATTSTCTELEQLLVVSVSPVTESTHAP